MMADERKQILKCSLLNIRWRALEIVVVVE